MGDCKVVEMGEGTNATARCAEQGDRRRYLWPAIVRAFTQHLWKDGETPLFGAVLEGHVGTTQAASHVVQDVCAGCMKVHEAGVRQSVFLLAHCPDLGSGGGCLSCL